MKALIPNIVSWEKLSAKAREKALRRPALTSRPGLGDAVGKIVARVRKDGDEALFALTKKLDGVVLRSLEVTSLERKRAIRRVDASVKRAIEKAAANIETFHSAQLPRAIDIEVAPGIRCGRRAVAIDRVGLYVPGGTASLPSTVLMLGIPARLAGCPTRVLCSPPRKDGGLDPHVIYAAETCGVGALFKVGGAQAIAAMAFGTKRVPKVDKIFGPGNAWVTEAKQQVARTPEGAPCDMPAGPSEVMVVADDAADPGFVAADLLSQAEHGADSQVVLVTPSKALVAEVGNALAAQLAALPRGDIARRALEKSLVVLVRDLETAMEVSNGYAPEHLILQVRAPGELAKRVRNAGSVFLGAWSPESVGDYASGTNHVLPTYGYARAMGGVGVAAFLKEITFQELTREGLLGIAETVETLAGIEGLDAHARAVSLRAGARAEAKLRTTRPRRDEEALA